MANCPKCYRAVPEGSLNCPGCFSRLVRIPPVVEIRHIDYLLGELAIWPARKLLTSEEALAIYGDYIRRRGELIGETQAATKPMSRQTWSTPQVRQQLHKVTSPTSAIAASAVPPPKA